jgi:hypothetical protein
MYQEGRRKPVKSKAERDPTKAGMREQRTPRHARPRLSEMVPGSELGTGDTFGMKVLAALTPGVVYPCHPANMFPQGTL